MTNRFGKQNPTGYLIISDETPWVRSNITHMHKERVGTKVGVGNKPNVSLLLPQLIYNKN